MALKGEIFIRTGIFVDQKHVDKLIEMVEVLTKKADLPEDKQYGIDIDMEIVEASNSTRGKTTGKFIDQEDFKDIMEYLNSVLVSYGMPIPTERCITGIQRNGEISISLVTDENELMRE